MSSAIVSSPRSRSTFEGYDCTSDCSGHEAGFRWAKAKDITVGEHSNSPSFAEGCHAYVDGGAQDDSDSNSDSDDNNNGDDN